MRAVDVVGVRVEMPSNQPIVLLRDQQTDRFLPIWIGAVEATAIAFAQQGVEPERPLTHDLLSDVVAALGRTLQRVDITDLRDGIFFANLIFDNGVTVSSRPSDAIALALRTGSPIFAAEHVLDTAAVEMPAEEEEAEAEMEAFREFLDQVTPEDFEGDNPQ